MSAIAGSFATTSTPTPSLPAQTPNPDSVTPGVLGFLVVFVLAIATWLLMRNMTSRLRRMRFREEQRRSVQARAAQAAPTTEPAEPDH